MVVMFFFGVVMVFSQVIWLCGVIRLLVVWLFRCIIWFIMLCLCVLIMLVLWFLVISMWIFFLVMEVVLFLFRLSICSISWVLCESSYIVGKVMCDSQFIGQVIRLVIFFEWVIVSCLGISLLKMSVRKVIRVIVSVLFILLVQINFGNRLCSYWVMVRLIVLLLKILVRMLISVMLIWIVDRKFLGFLDSFSVCVVCLLLVVICLSWFLCEVMIDILDMVKKLLSRIRVRIIISLNMGVVFGWWQGGCV